MGDRVSCTLTVLPEHRDSAIKSIAREEGMPDEEFIDQNDSLGLIHLDYYDVNYGEIVALDELQKAGIAYDFHWDRGDGFDAGYHHVRFTESGEMQFVQTTSDSNATLDIEDIKLWLKEPNTLRENLESWVKNNDLLPWDNQAEYGKCYLARQLITG